MFAALAFVACGQTAATPTAATGAPVPVRIEVLAPAALDRVLEATGAVEAFDSVELRPEVPGLVERVAFEDGEVVKRGQVLVRLRDRDAQAALLDARARATLASLELDRGKVLFERGDLARAELDAAEAAEGLSRATLMRAEESVRRTVIVAPFDGVVGRRDVSPGELVDPTRVLTRVEALGRLTVDLALPESALARVAKGQAATILADPTGAPIPGIVSYVAPRLREDTRTIDVRITVEDPAGRLRPGMTATARILTAQLTDALLVPAESVVRSARGVAVYVVAADGTVDLRPVETGERTAERLELTGGVAAGETVVVEGLARLRPGAKVEVQAPVAGP